MRKIFKNKYIFSGSILVILTGMVFGSYFLGFRRGTEKPKEIKIDEVKNLNKGNKDAVDFNLFWETWQTIKEKYVDASKIDNQKLVYGAISGMVSALGDPHTLFFSPDEAKEFGEEISGEFSGIGIEIGTRDDQLVVIAPLKGTPAYKAGIKAGDKILKIGDKDTIGINQDEAVKLIRGPKGTKITLLIGRNDEKGKEFTIVRDTIQIPTLDWEMKGDVAYIRLYNFYEKAPSLFYKAAIGALMKNPKGIVLDLRDNPGGFLDAGINISGWFLPKGKLIVKEEFASGEPTTFTNTIDGYLKDIPLVILVNQGSASASEIMAGALRDNRGIKLIGEKTFGKGTVQELVDLSENAEVKITIAHWVMPNGGKIEKDGLAPDYEVKITDEDVQKGKDPQLDKALEIIKTMQ